MDPLGPVGWVGEKWLQENVNKVLVVIFTMQNIFPARTAVFALIRVQLRGN